MFLHLKNMVVSFQEDLYTTSMDKFTQNIKNQKIALSKVYTK